MKNSIAISLALAGCLLSAACSHTSDSYNLDGQLANCDTKVRKTLADLSAQGSIDYTMMPRNIQGADTTWHCRPCCPQEWCSGFWPGVLWLNYENTRSEDMLYQARMFTAPLDSLASLPVYDHDLGFLMLTSVGQGYRLTGDRHYRDVLLAAADSLATLYNPAVGTLLSWPRNVELFGGHNTIMDNMINLELLLWASRNGGDEHLRDIAISHADTTMAYHFRPDATCYHVAVYNPADGHFIKGVTHQGYADSSTWARGQAWAVYGYTVMYRETRLPRYLDFACRVSDAFIDRLPSDLVPVWDFDDPRGLSAPRDASAAAVVASALLELQQYAPADKAPRYLDTAKGMLASLGSDDYTSAPAKASILDHSTGHHPAGSEIDASIIYAEYYYMEALMRLRHLQQGLALDQALAAR